MLHRSFARDNFNVETLPLERESSLSSSLSSWLDSFSFVINDSDDDVILPVVQNLLNCQQQLQQHIIFLLQIRHARTKLTPSASRHHVKKRCIKRDREQTHDRLYKDYFAEDSIYIEHHFRHRFRMQKHLFLHVVKVLHNHSGYF